MQIQVCIWLWPEEFLKLFKTYDCASHRNVLFMVSSFFSPSFAYTPPPVHKENFPSFIWFLILNLFILIEKQQKLKRHVKVCYFSTCVSKYIQNFNRHHHDTIPQNVLDFGTKCPLPGFMRDDFSVKLLNF